MEKYTQKPHSILLSSYPSVFGSFVLSQPLSPIPFSSPPRLSEMKKNLKELEKKKKNEQRCNAEGEGMHKTKAQREKEIGTETETQSIHADRCAKSGKSRTQGNKL